MKKQPSKPGKPQTLRQAKNAYRRRSTRNAQLSERELAQAERRDILYERARKIREREERRKDNAKKKSEKVEKEREMLLRQGRPLPKEPGIKIGPSQMELSRFVVEVEQGCGDDGRGNDGAGKRDVEMEMMEQEKEKETEMLARETLTQIFRTSKTCARKESYTAVDGEAENTVKKEPVVVKIEKFEANNRPPRSMRTTSSKLSTSKNITLVSIPHPPTIPQPQSAPTFLRPALPASRSRPPPPPTSRFLLPPPLPLLPRSAAALKPRTQSLPSKDFAPKATTVASEDLNDFFPSNTQVSREISSSPASPPHLPVASISIPPIPAVPTSADLGFLLSSLSSQDLVYTPTQAPLSPPPQRNRNADTGRRESIAYAQAARRPQRATRMTTQASANSRPANVSESRQERPLDLTVRDIDVGHIGSSNGTDDDNATITTTTNNTSGSFEYGDGIADDDLSALAEEVEAYARSSGQSSATSSGSSTARWTKERRGRKEGMKNEVTIQEQREGEIVYGSKRRREHADPMIWEPSGLEQRSARRSGIGVGVV